jgi:hypothetical protein
MFNCKNRLIFEQGETFKHVIWNGSEIKLKISK